MNIPSFSLKGKVALVTGASRGIGHAIAHTLAEAGADIALVSRKQEKLDEVAKEIEERGRKAKGFACHAGKLDQLENMTKQVKAEFGKIDILVNNAGTNPANIPLLDYEERLWDSIMNLNLKGVAFLTKHVANIMKKQGGGSIISIASVEAFMVGDLSIAYDASKAGLVHFTKAAAVELAPHNIRVNAIAPGFVKTQLVSGLWGNEEIKSALVSRIPMNRMAQPEEMAGAVLYFASNASSYATGSTLVVDGGITLQ